MREPVYSAVPKSLFTSHNGVLTAIQQMTPNHPNDINPNNENIRLVAIVNIYRKNYVTFSDEVSYANRSYDEVVVELNDKLHELSSVFHENEEVLEMLMDKVSPQLKRIDEQRPPKKRRTHSEHMMESSMQTQIGKTIQLKIPKDLSGTKEMFAKQVADVMKNYMQEILAHAVTNRGYANALHTINLGTLSVMLYRWIRREPHVLDGFNEYYLRCNGKTCGDPPDLPIEIWAQRFPRTSTLPDHEWEEGQVLVMVPEPEPKMIPLRTQLGNNVIYKNEQLFTNDAQWIMSEDRTYATRVPPIEDDVSS